MDHPPLPPFRALWEDLRLADAAWCHALQAHRDSNDPVTLPDRLAVTAAAATHCSRQLTRVAGTGLQWNPFPGPPSRHDLPGELSTSERHDAPDGWITLGQAAERLAEASCDSDMDRLASAFALFSNACSYLRGQVTGGSKV